MMKKFSCLLMVLIFLFNIFPFGTARAEEEGTDVTSILTELVVSVSQEDEIIEPGGVITSTAPISIELSFGVPVEGDEPTPPSPIQHNDYAVFPLSASFKLLTSDYIPLMQGDINVGHVSFATDPETGMLYAYVIFDGDAEVFDGTYNTVECRFSALLQYDDSGEAGEPGEHLVDILEKTFIVEVPPLETEISVTKTGTYDMAHKRIDWTVVITATQGEAAMDLAGYYFSDDLSAVGKYIEDSFQVDGEPVQPLLEAKVLSYTFAEGDISPKTISFSTEIDDDAYYATDEQRVYNTAKLYDSEDIFITEGPGSVSFTPEWIEKAGQASDGGGGIYDPTNRTITWTIIVNHLEAAIDNAKIVDMLPAGLEFVSAGWQPWVDGQWGDSVSIEPDETGNYYLGPIDSRIRLTIVSSVPDEEFTAGVTTYYNSARLYGEGLPGEGLGSGTIGVPVGYSSITKKGTADPASSSIHWQVTVDARGQTIPDLKVYDLLVYDSSFNAAGAQGFPSGLNPGDLTPRFDQQYSGDSFSGAGLTLTVHPITRSGERVADLLEVTGFTMDEQSTFSFDALIRNPAIFAGNKTSSVWNTASLFSGVTKLLDASARVNFTSQTLKKEMLKREAVSDPVLGVNERTSDLNEGFDYLDKSIVFRLSINADALDLTEMKDGVGQVLGSAIVTDTLPEGWRFAEILPGTQYLVFAGVSGPGGAVIALDTPLDTVAGLTAAFAGGTAAFTFEKLDRPYVILVKARPTEELLASYFDANKITTERNTLKLHTENWEPGVSTYQDFTITSQVLDKSLAIIPQKGELLWTVEYRPYDLLHLGTKLEDKIPQGLELRRDARGALLLGVGTLCGWELLLNPDGSYELGAELTLVEGENVSYDDLARVLTINIPDSTRGYRFSYVTDITGEPGTVANKVSLYGLDEVQEETEVPYLITAADGEASLRKNGWLEITKTDGVGALLPGAEFTIYSLDGSAIIRRGVTDAAGYLRFKVIPDGEYILKETAAPDGYTAEPVSHSLTVVTIDGTVYTSIDGQEGDNSNAAGIKNYPQGAAGNLTICKTVSGDGASAVKAFDFTIFLVGADEEYEYHGTNVPNGVIKSGDVISLAHGQCITILGLPEGTEYRVVEEDYSREGYYQYAEGDEGIIVGDDTLTASFTNTRNLGELSIRKTVTGDLGELEREFSFLVTFSAIGEYSYTGSKTGTIESGGVITLKHGEEVTIQGLPVGAEYCVTEIEANEDGYETSAVGAEGTIGQAPGLAAFVNSRASVPKTGDDGPNPLWPIGFILSALLFLTLGSLGRLRKTEV